jgi:hypothetical protein
MRRNLQRAIILSLVMIRGFGENVLLHLTIDPNDPTRLFAVTQRNELLASRDGGLSWTSVAGP